MEDINLYVLGFLDSRKLSFAVGVEKINLSQIVVVTYF